MNRFFISILVLVLLTGCVADGFRITDLADEPYVFRGQVISAATGMPVTGMQIKFFTWYQPLNPGMRAYLWLGETITDNEGRFEFETTELEVGLWVEHPFTVYNAYGTQPFDPRIEQRFILNTTYRMGGRVGYFERDNI